MDLEAIATSTIGSSKCSTVVQEMEGYSRVLRTTESPFGCEVDEWIDADGHGANLERERTQVFEFGLIIVARFGTYHPSVNHDGEAFPVTHFRLNAEHPETQRATETPVSVEQHSVNPQNDFLRDSLRLGDLRVNPFSTAQFSDEMHFSTGADVPERLKAEALKARAARREINLALPCSVCVLAPDTS